jgi:hypothetical protein
MLQVAVEWAQANGWTIDHFPQPHDSKKCCCPFGAVLLMEMEPFEDGRPNSWKRLPTNIRYPSFHDFNGRIRVKCVQAFMHGFDSFIDDPYSDKLLEQYRQLGRAYRFQTVELT